jgi:hypothetical protein
VNLYSDTDRYGMIASTRSSGRNRQDRECGMLDLTGILFSSVMMLIVVVRALQLDRAQPWFPAVRRKQAADAAGPRVWRRNKL